MEGDKTSLVWLRWNLKKNKSLPDTPNEALAQEIEVLN